MSGIRDHKAFTVKYTVKGYNGGNPMFMTDLVIASNSEIAKAWVTSKVNFDEFISCDGGVKISAFIHEHIW